MEFPNTKIGHYLPEPNANKAKSTSCVDQYGKIKLREWNKWAKEIQKAGKPL
jgi:hypothetical protein